MMNKKLKLLEVLERISKGECLNCLNNIGASFHNTYRWRTPLCRKCRQEYFDEALEKVEVKE